MKTLGIHMSYYVPRVTAYGGAVRSTIQFLTECLTQRNFQFCTLHSWWAHIQVYNLKFLRPWLWCVILISRHVEVFLLPVLFNTSGIPGRFVPWEQQAILHSWAVSRIRSWPGTLDASKHLAAYRTHSCCLNGTQIHACILSWSTQNWKWDKNTFIMPSKSILNI